MSEKDYERGSRAAWTAMLRRCLAQLGGKDRARNVWRLEREAAIAVLRDLCEEYGDNDWHDDLHLADVIEKHLGRHLGE